jgi:hypothetical protein
VRARSPAQRVRHLISLEAGALVVQLKARGDEAVVLFSRLRDRSPLLAATRSRLSELSFEHVSLLEPHEQRAVLVFCEAVERCQWYARYTEDMPSTAKSVLLGLSTELETRLLALTQVIGTPEAEGAPTVQSAVRAKARLKKKKET